jgi:hypothetical protein
VSDTDRIEMLYRCAGRAAARGELDLDQVNMMLLAPGYEPDLERDETVDDVREFEIEPSGGYRAGGARLARNPDGFNPVRWEDFTAEFRWAIYYRADTGALVAVADLGVQCVTRGNAQVGDIVVDDRLAPRAPVETIDDLLAELLH